MKRREFIIKTSLLTAGAGVGLMACENNIVPVSVPDGERIRLGIIGLGDRGSTIIQVLNQLPEFKIIAACDILDFRLEKGLENIKDKATGYSDYRKLLENKELDVVVVSAPLHEHHRMVMDALDADVHIMCEKALAYDIDQSRELKIKADQSSKLFQVSYQYQLNPTFNAVKDLINKGYCGKIMRIDANWHRNSNWRRPVPSPELERQINWRMYREYSGGLMAELGSHHLNMIDNIYGSHPIRVTGSGGVDYWKDGRKIFDNVHALFDYPGGVKASFSSILSNKFEDQTIKFYGDKATIVTNRMNEAYIYAEESAEQDLVDEIDGVTGASIMIVKKDKRKRNVKAVEAMVEGNPFEDNYRKTTWLLYHNFADAIKGRAGLKLGLKDGYQSAISVHMANKALREDRIEKWLPEYDV